MAELTTEQKQELVGAVEKVIAREQDDADKLNTQISNKLDELLGVISGLQRQSDEGTIHFDDGALLKRHADELVAMLNLYNATGVYVGSLETLIASITG